MNAGNSATPTGSHLVDPAAFLEMLHGPDAFVYFQTAQKTWKNKPQTFRQAEKTLRWRNNEGDDVCFVVNSGGTTNASIQKINAFWIDWDCGRDDAGHYHPDPYVLQAKADFRQRLLDAFVPAPSIVVETRNGLHVYWLVKDGVTLPEFKEVQARLSAHFSSDPAVNRACALMRLPGFDWVKPATGLPRFPIKATLLSPVRFQASELLRVLAPVPMPVLSIPSAMPIGGHNKCRGNTHYCTYCGPQTPTSSNPITVVSAAKATEYFKKQDLAHFLGIQINQAHLPATVLCPFHPDKTPSATIHCDPAQGHWLFKCHSSRCGKSGTIIDLAPHHLQLTPQAAYQRLLDHFNVVIDTGWKKQQIDSLDLNIQIITDPALKDTHPALHRWIDRVRHDLIDKLRLARKHVVSERNEVDGRSVFFASLREMSRRRSKTGAKTPGFGKQPARVDRYCALGLLTKLPDEKVPKHLREESEVRRIRSNRPYRVSYFAVPEYTPQLLDEANRRAQMLIDAGATANGISRTLILDVLGEKIAGEVYPQVKDAKKPDPYSARVTDAVTALITAQGYATTRAVLDATRHEAEWASITLRRIHKCLPGVLKRCGLKKTVCTAAMKQKFGIAAEGFPQVIVPAE